MLRNGPTGTSQVEERTPLQVYIVARSRVNGDAGKVGKVIGAKFVRPFTNPPAPTASRETYGDLRLHVKYITIRAQRQA